MEAISMSGRERKRLVVLSQVGAGKLRLRAVAELLGVSYRQMKRVWSRYQAEGDLGLVHGLRGKAANRQRESSLRERVLARYRESYGDYGPTLAAESLAESQLVRGSSRVGGVDGDDRRRDWPDLRAVL